jgi:hypothetical protein
MNNFVAVANAWKRGQALTQGTMRTDGHTIYSYEHPIGVTEPDGTKVAFDCAASATTGKHGSHARQIAHKVEACPNRGHHRERIDREVRLGRLPWNPARQGVLTNR